MFCTCVSPYLTIWQVLGNLEYAVLKTVKGRNINTSATRYVGGGRNGGKYLLRGMRMWEPTLWKVGGVQEKNVSPAKI
jgi:hypothetical protein